MPYAVKKKSLLKRGQFWVGIFLVLALQMGFIFWLGARRPVEPRAPLPASELQLVDPGYAEVLQLLDPTLFALPHEQGFSGPGWLIPPVQEIQPFAWSEPRRWLDLPVAQLGAAFSQSIGTNRFEPLPAPAALEPELLIPALSGNPPFSQQSTFRLEAGLAGRRLLTVPQLPPWPAAELVSNTVVQLVVDPRGLPFSLCLLERSGNAEADQYAMQESRKLRFAALPHAAPDPSPANGLAWGTIIFEWHTVPLAPNPKPPARTP